MPWKKGDYPPSMKNLPEKVRNKAVEIANAVLEETGNEGLAIAVGVKNAKKRVKTSRKSKLKGEE